jgi:hypothetical protein
MSQVTKYLITLLVGAALGYAVMPRKIETKMVEVEKKQVDTERVKHKETTTTETQAPDGAKTTITKTTEDTGTQRKSTTDKSVDNDTIRTYGGTGGSISLLAGAHNFDPSQIDLGLSVTKNVLGPIQIGAFGFKSGMVGLSLGVQF